MRKYLKIILGCFMSSFILIFSSNITYAEITNIIDVEVSEQNTYFITENGELFGNDDNNNVIKIADKVKKFQDRSIYEFELTYLNDEGTLFVVWTYSSDSDFSIYEFEKDVKDMYFTYDSEYVIKNDNKLYKYDVSYSFDFETLIPDINKEFIADDVKSVSSVDYGDFIFIKNDDSLWLSTKDIKEAPIKIMDNVKEAKITINDLIILDNDMNLYSVDINNISSNMDIKELNLLESDVKKFNVVSSPSDIFKSECIFIIKNDNTLWVKGKHSRGALGLGQKNIEVLEFTKIADNVIDISGSANHAIFVTEDGKLFGMGKNGSGQLGDIKGDSYNYFDENGFYKIMENVKSADIHDEVTTVVKNDNSLWAFGRNIENVLIDENINNISEPIKIVDNVSYGKYDRGLGYISLKDNKLHYNNASNNITDEMINSLDEKSKEELFLQMYKYLFNLLDIDYSNYSSVLDIENSMELEDIVVNKYDELSEDEQKNIEFAMNEYIKEQYSKYFKSSFGENVTMFSGEFYINQNNEVFKINYSGEDIKLFEDIIFIKLLYNDILFLIDTNNILYYYNLENYYTKDKLVLEEIKIGNIKAVEFNYRNLQLLKDDGSLLFLEKISDCLYYNEVGGLEGILSIYDYDGELTGEKHNGYVKYDAREILKKENIEVEINDKNVAIYLKDGQNMTYLTSSDIYDFKDIISIGDELYLVKNTIEGVLEFSSGRYHTVYIDKNDVLWGIGENYNNQLGIDEYFIVEPKKIMTDVREVSADNNSTIIIKNDGTLIGMGNNDNGQLGFEAQGEGYSVYNVYNPTEISFNY